jgi:hypothetical protein
VIHFKIGDRREVDPATDEMGRSWIGLVDGMTAQEVYDRNRGMWFLGRQALGHRFAVFTSLATKLGIAVVGIQRIEDFPGSAKRAVVGTVLGPGHPVHDRYVGQPAPDRYRNPKTFHPDPDVPAARCACGCGEDVTGGRAFRIGHDQRAIRERINRQWGGALGFIQWFDEQYGANEESAAA